VPGTWLTRADDQPGQRPAHTQPDHRINLRRPATAGALPDDEERLWHSHRYEVKSGMLAAPGIPERACFTDLVTTYGKTFHTWQYDRDDFPYGIPPLMTGLTADGQLDEALVAAANQGDGR
jgi:hypothetical protein